MIFYFQSSPTAFPMGEFGRVFKDISVVSDDVYICYIIRSLNKKIKRATPLCELTSQNREKFRKGLKRGL